MSDERYALPGFYPPNSPSLDAQVFSQPDGSIEIVIADNLDAKALLPDYMVYITTEYGREIHLQATAGNRHICVKLMPNGTKAHVLTITKEDIIFEPGTYMVRVMDGNREVFAKSLTVVNHPAFPWARTPHPCPGETEGQVYQKIG